MTDQERKAMEMALDALENNQPVNYCQNNNGERFPMFKEDPFRFDCNSKAIKALRQALAQPEQEPTPVGMTCKVWTHGCALFDGIDLPNETLLYTSPPSKPWVSLNDDEIIDEYCKQADGTEWAIGGLKDAMPFARAIEAALKEKNT